MKVLKILKILKIFEKFWKFLKIFENFWKFLKFFEKFWKFWKFWCASNTRSLPNFFWEFDKWRASVISHKKLFPQIRASFTHDARAGQMRVLSRNFFWDVDKWRARVRCAEIRVFYHRPSVGVWGRLLRKTLGQQVQTVSTEWFIVPTISLGQHKELTRLHWLSRFYIKTGRLTSYQNRPIIIITFQLLSVSGNISSDSLTSSSIIVWKKHSMLIFG